jgi:hypothetical protein
MEKQVKNKASSVNSQKLPEPPFLEKLEGLIGFEKILKQMEKEGSSDP